MRYKILVISILFSVLGFMTCDSSSKDLASDIETVNNSNDLVKYSFSGLKYCVVINRLMEEEFDTALELLEDKDPTSYAAYTKGECPGKDIIGKCESSLFGNTLELLNTYSDYNVEIITLTAYIYGDDSNPLTEPGLMSLCLNTGLPPIIDKGEWTKND